MNHVGVKCAGRVAAVALLVLGAITVVPLTAAPQSVTFTNNSNALVLSPFHSQFTSGFFGGQDVGDTIAADVGNMCGGPLANYNGFLTDSGANVDAFERMQTPFGVVAISSHGGIWPETQNPSLNQVIILTGEVSGPSDPELLTRLKQLSHYELINWDYASIDGLGKNVSNPYWAITPAFVRDYGHGLSNSIVYAGACDSDADATGDTMDGAFDSYAHVGAYFGYSFNVNNTTEFPWITSGQVESGTNIFNILTDMTKKPEDRTASVAYEQADGSANLVPFDSNVAIYNTVTNGGFETGDLTGWTKHFEPGAGPLGGYDCTTEPKYHCSPAPDGPYVVATHETSHSGTYSAQIGKWGTQFYCNHIQISPPAGDGLGCAPQSGEAPAGDDQIYQDVQLGSGQQGGPAPQITFSFDYLPAPEGRPSNLPS